VPEQQALQRIQRVIGLGKVGEQGRVVGRGGLAFPVGTKLLENLAKTALAIDQAQDFGAIFAETPECWCCSTKGWPRLLPKTCAAISPVSGS
jgi:hypothetical protein